MASEALKRAVRKYDEKTYDRITIRLPKGTAEEIKALGVSVNSFVVNAALEKLTEMQVGK